MSEIDYLIEDSNLPSGQNFVCLSLYMDKQVLKAVKIRGAYNSYDDACKQATNLRKDDQYFDVFVGENGKWLAVDPSKKINDMVQLNDMLNLNMKNYMKSHENNKSLHEYRKNNLVISNLDENLKIRKQNMEELKNKLTGIKDECELDNVLQSIKSVQEELDKMEKKKNELLEENTKYSNKLGNNINDSSNYTQHNNLEENKNTVKYDDDNLPASQKFVCLSFLSHKYYKLPHDLLGVKVRGIFATEEEANTMAKKLQSIDEYFHIFVGECGKWLAFDPDADSNATTSEYSNEQLNKMMKGYKENQEKAQIFKEQRKSEELRSTLLENLNKTETNLKTMKKKLSKSTGNEKVELENSMKSIEEQIASMELKKKELDVQVKTLTDKVDSFPKPELTLPKIIEIPDE